MAYSQVGKRFVSSIERSGLLHCFSTILVYRGGLSPEKLLGRLAPPQEHIATLYDVLESTVATLPEVRLLALALALSCALSIASALTSKLIQAPYLGTRSTDANGQPGPYTWMTYAQVSA